MRICRMSLSSKLFLMLLLLAMSVLAGCDGTGGETAEDVSKDMLANMNEMAAILTSVTDEPSAKAAVPRIEAVRAKMRECAARARSVPRLNAAEEQKLNEMMLSGMQEPMAVIGTAQTRLATQPELLAILAPAMEGMENDL